MDDNKERVKDAKLEIIIWAGIGIFLTLFGVFLSAVAVENQNGGVSSIGSIITGIGIAAISVAGIAKGVQVGNRSS